MSKIDLSELENLELMPCFYQYSKKQTSYSNPNYTIQIIEESPIDEIDDDLFNNLFYHSSIKDNIEDQNLNVKKPKGKKTKGKKKRKGKKQTSKKTKGKKS